MIRSMEGFTFAPALDLNLSSQLIVEEECHPFPIPEIGDIIHSMEGFTFAPALDLI
jgi:hypothetical protein